MKLITGIKAVKFVTGIVVGSGVGLVTGNIAKSFMPEDLSKIGRIQYLIGSSAITGLVGAAVGKRIEAPFDKIIKNLEAVENAATPRTATDEEDEATLQGALDKLSKNEQDLFLGYVMEQVNTEIAREARKGQS